MKIEVTENKSRGALAPWDSLVRVFVDRDFSYGYFVRERRLFGLLTEAQQGVYLQGDSVSLDVSVEVAQQIVDMGATPYCKPKLM